MILENTSFLEYYNNSLFGIPETNIDVLKISIFQ